MEPSGTALLRAALLIEALDLTISKDGANEVLSFLFKHLHGEGASIGRRGTTKGVAQGRQAGPDLPLTL